MKVGDWAHTVHEGNKITGFILEQATDYTALQVAIPNNYGIIAVENERLIESKHAISMDDIPDLIELAKRTNDDGWIDELRYELSLWKNVNEL